MVQNKELNELFNLDLSIFELHNWLIVNKKIYIEIRPIDDWSGWFYRIYMEDCMSPFFMATGNSFYSNPPTTYENCLIDALNELYLLLEC
jgi:hypothetical protein